MSAGRLVAGRSTPPSLGRAGRPGDPDEGPVAAVARPRRGGVGGGAVVFRGIRLV